MKNNSIAAWFSQHDCKRVRNYLQILVLAKKQKVTREDCQLKLGMSWGCVAWRIDELHTVGLLKKCGNKETTKGCKAECFKLAENWSYHQIIEALDLKKSTEIKKKTLSLLLTDCGMYFERTQLDHLHKQINQIAKLRKATV